MFTYKGEFIRLELMNIANVSDIRSETVLFRICSKMVKNEMWAFFLIEECVETVNIVYRAVNYAKEA